MRRENKVKRIMNGLSAVPSVINSAIKMTFLLMSIVFVVATIALTLGAAKRIPGVTNHSHPLGPSVAQKHRQMLYPSVRVVGKRGIGSGTVLWSKKINNRGYKTYILTNFHVVNDRVSITDGWDEKRRKKYKKETRSFVVVQMFKYNKRSHMMGIYSVKADIAAYSKDNDLALLVSRDTKTRPLFVAHMLPRNRGREISITDEVYAVGAALGHAPIITRGIINHKSDEFGGKIYWMSSAQIIFGNSGGAMFKWSHLRKRFEIIGVPSLVMGQRAGVAVPYLGLFIPMDRVYDFLKENLYRFMYSSKYSWETESSARKSLFGSKE